LQLPAERIIHSKRNNYCFIFLDSKGALSAMNHIIRHSLYITALCISSVAVADTIPYLAPRSQGINSARELVGWQSQINQWNMCCNYGSLSIAPEYTKTFRHDCIAKSLFGEALVDGSTTTSGATNSCNNKHDCGCQKILIQGSQVNDRNEHALLAENFYLPTDFSSEITVKPAVENIIVDFDYYQGFDEFAEGWYFRIHSPLVNTRWNLNYCEKVTAAGKHAMDPGYFNNSYDFTDTGSIGISRDNLPKDFTDYVCHRATIKNTGDTTYETLRQARWDTCTKTKTGLAEITAALGCNFIRHENFLFGLNLRAAAPTGNRPHGEYLFEPMVGNGHHWEFGAGLDMWWVCWKSQAEDRNLTLYVDANVTHLFTAQQWRTFDLRDTSKKNVKGFVNNDDCTQKPLSRYMLAMKLTDSVNNLLAGKSPSPTKPNYQFAGIFSPVANLTTIPVDVNYAAQGEIIFKLAYTHYNFQFDIGYNFWGRTFADIRKRCNCSNELKDHTWALKGDAFTYGFASTDHTKPGIALSATESEATIFAGTNNYASTPEDWGTNHNIDNPQNAWHDSATPLYTLGSSWQQVETSLNPVLLTEDNIDICSARTKAYSNKVFAHLGYIWKDVECWTPYLGIGGEAEFGSDGGDCHHRCHNKYCSANSKSVDFAFSQWGVWLKGGFTFY
jgi:hypothetical protein